RAEFFRVARTAARSVPQSKDDANLNQDIEKRRLNLQDAGAHLVDEIEKDFVFGQGAQRRHEKFRIKRDGKLAPFILDGQRFLRFADLRRVGGDLDVVLAEIEFDRIRFVARQQRNASQGIKKCFALEFYALLCFSRNNLAIIRIIAFDQFRNEQRLFQIERDLA